MASRNRTGGCNGVTASDPLLLLNTRPRNLALETGKILQSYGYRVIESPVLEIYYPPQGKQAFLQGLSRADAVIFSSVQAPLAFSAPDIHCKLAVFAVGERAAASAKKAGFHGKIYEFLNAKALAQALENHADLRFLYGAGRDRKPDIEAALQKKRIDYELCELYEANAATRLSDVAEQALQTGALTKILLFSRRSVEALAEILRNYPAVNAKKDHLEIFAVSGEVVTLFPKTKLFSTPAELIRYFQP